MVSEPDATSWQTTVTIILNVLFEKVDRLESSYEADNYQMFIRFLQYLSGILRKGHSLRNRRGVAPCTLCKILITFPISLSHQLPEIGRKYSS